MESGALFQPCLGQAPHETPRQRHKCKVDLAQSALSGCLMHDAHPDNDVNARLTLQNARCLGVRRLMPTRCAVWRRSACSLERRFCTTLANLQANGAVAPLAARFVPDTCQPLDTTAPALTFIQVRDPYARSARFSPLHREPRGRNAPRGASNGQPYARSARFSPLLAITCLYQ